MLGPTCAAVVACLLTAPASAIEFGLPADCEVGKDCFFQQYPDMDPGPEARDPFCGAATYNGHSGTDLRVLSLRDMERGVSVTAMADGKVLRQRDGEPDRLVRSEADRAALAGKDCGNGVVVAHEDGYETQYCHLRRGSISVEPGDDVKRGDSLGKIGASGMAQFPHVHVTVRKDGVDLDPATGKRLDAGCLADASAAEPLFAPEVVALLSRGETDLLGLGLAGNVVEHESLVVAGAPPAATATSNATVAWAWFVNLRGGDRLRFRIAGPDGNVLIDQTTEPLERAKASYSAYAGKRGALAPGSYTVTVTLLRDGTPVLEKSAEALVD